VEDSQLESYFRFDSKGIDESWTLFSIRYIGDVCVIELYYYLGSICNFEMMLGLL
jgi:hypothetical protein